MGYRARPGQLLPPAVVDPELGGEAELRPGPATNEIPQGHIVGLIHNDIHSGIIIISSDGMPTLVDLDAAYPDGEEMTQGVVYTSSLRLSFPFRQVLLRVSASVGPSVLLAWSAATPYRWVGTCPSNTTSRRSPEWTASTRAGISAALEGETSARCLLDRHRGERRGLPFFFSTSPYSSHSTSNRGS